MPRINKIRVTGARYDNFRKGYDDTIFDFTKNEEPDHTLFTLVNQGGKGVLMQLISQIAIPGTRWGRESGNHLISMFYDRHKNFKPYTFHVIIEWKLDTVPERWLITGVCVTAERKFAQEDQEDRTGLNYFHYTLEHDKRGFYSIESLPVYDSKEGRPSDYDAYERFIDENGRYIVKYPMSQTRRLNSPYYEYLKSRGILRAEWEMMKIINKLEGGVSSYFSTAADNKSVIDRMLIPAITQNMNNYGENTGENLKDMFISNLSITRDLPRLLERENDYRELLILIAPLMECAARGYETQKKLRKHVTEGNTILATLNNSMGKVLERKLSWEAQLADAEAELEHYRFENDNMEYARYKKEQKSKRERLDGINIETADCEKHLSMDEQSKIELETDILLTERERLLKERQGSIDEKQYLIESMGLDDLKNAVLDIEAVIIEKWGRNRGYFEEIIKKHNGYRKYLGQANMVLDENKRREERRLSDVKTKIAVFNEREKRHKEAFDKLSGYFDPFSLAVPEYLLEELEKEAEKRKARIFELEELMKEAQKALDKKTEDRYKAKVDLESVKEELSKAEESLRQAQKSENELKNRICKAIGMDPVLVVYTHAWAKSMTRSIEDIMDGERQRIDGLKTSMWELNVDLGINNKEYWIPNRDLLNLKEAALSVGAGPVQTGTEFLFGIEDKDRNKLIEAEPLLPYGIVIPSKKEWEIIENNLSRDIFLRAAVPVFIRENVDRAGVKSVINMGHRLAIDTGEYGDWHSRLQEKAEALKESIDAIEQKVEKLTGIKMEIRNITSQPESNVILKNVNVLKEKTAGIERDISSIDVDIAKLEENLAEYGSGRDVLKAEEERESGKIAMVSAYVDEELLIKEQQPLIDKLLSDEKEMTAKIDEAEEQKNRNNESLVKDREHFTEWKVELQGKLDSLKKIIPDAFADYKKEGALEEYPPDYDTSGVDGIFDDVKKRLSLDAEIEAKNAHIKVLDERLAGIGEKISQNEKALDETQKDWRNRETPQRSEFHLKSLLSDIKIKIRESQKKLNDMKSTAMKLDGELVQIEKSLSNVRRRLNDRYNRQAQSWEDEDLEKKEFEIRRNITACKRKIESIKTFIKDTEKEYNEINLSVNTLKEYEDIDMLKGTVDESLAVKLQKETRKLVGVWQEEYRDLKRRVSDDERKMRGLLDIFRNDIKVRIKEKILLEKLLAEIQSINAENFKGNLDAFTSMEEHFKKELEITSSDKSKAEQVREQWAQRAAKHIIRIIELIKEMVHGMIYVNQSGNAFPLVRLAGEELMPTKEEDIIVLLKEHFIVSINKVIEMDLKPEEIDRRLLDEMMGDPVLFSKALRGRYPTLMVYKMTEKNEFRYAKPHDYYYASWEAINRGEEGSAEGSGGQKLSICTFMMMMLVNFKKRSIGSKNPWTVLLMDNPFGQASAKHILDPIFEIADSLNFQLVAFAPPEIVKIDISKRFPVFWELRIESGSGGMDVVTSRLVHGGRTIMK